MTTDALNTNNVCVVAALKTTHSFLVFPEDLNYAGTLFGGKILAEMDRTALKAARRLLYKTACDGAVTVSLDKVDFKQPANLGDIIELHAEIRGLGNTSIHIHVQVIREDHIGNTATICEASFVFVSMKNGSPFPHQCVLDSTYLNNN